MDLVAVNAVALIVTLTGLLYYHFQFFYSVKSVVFANVKNNLEKLWQDKILPANQSYFTTRLTDTVQVVDSYNTNIAPIVNNTLNIVDDAEVSCNRGTDWLIISLEIMIILFLAGTLFGGVA